MKYALVGYGRMGREIEEQAAGRGHERVAVLDAATTIDREALAGAEVAFEFTRPDVAEANVLRLIASGVGVVCGTTGWSPEGAVSAAAGESAAGVVVAANFSLGMQLFYRLVRQAGGLFGRVGGYDPFVLEAHHRGKRDAPSGTAERLAALLLEVDPGLTEVETGRPSGPLPSHVLPVASVRAGAEPGTHVIGFDGPSDRIQLEHRARGRSGFALGAVMAGEWIRESRGLVTFEQLVDRVLEGRSE